MYRFSTFWVCLKLLIVSITLLFSGQLAAQASQQGEITIISEYWADATEKNGSGLYFDIMKRVFEPLGYTIKTQTTTYSRSVKLVQSKRMDVFLGSYLDEQEDVLYPRWHFDAEQVAAIYKPSVIANWQGEASLKGKTVA
ncbi:hypothetical protein [Enterovibrio nigricans]|uniref:Polar amino acid transport system substrate-binding protein n=1 Tax=Enterovibrio nigricans DSM 22720 TaxID=1121868 RepID=A0A1T4VLL6_9GAMM|nr:hypothetical protein [Enterovibrio nigricans]PKF49479.1 hypothetical protein AT251_18475 [Enterovibrio nigricans]SKA65864.1 polar amino acid transport system substrate-binding protein [Enterovibrio nigricans DSM 22720]